jgi:hypothetical protein
MNYLRTKSVDTSFSKQLIKLIAKNQTHIVTFYHINLFKGDIDMQLSATRAIEHWLSEKYIPYL